jgi:hypothetical protein
MLFASIAFSLMTTRNISWGVKTASTTSMCRRLEIWEPQPLETPTTCPGLTGFALGRRGPLRTVAPTGRGEYICSAGPGTNCNGPADTNICSGRWSLPLYVKGSLVKRVGGLYGFAVTKTIVRKVSIPGY